MKVSEKAENWLVFRLLFREAIKQHLSVESVLIINSFFAKKDVCNDDERKRKMCDLKLLSGNEQKWVPLLCSSSNFLKMSDVKDVKNKVVNLHLISSSRHRRNWKFLNVVVGGFERKSVTGVTKLTMPISDPVATSKEKLILLSCSCQIWQSGLIIRDGF